VHEVTRAERRAARERVARYYETELAKLVDHVGQAIARYRGGEIGRGPVVFALEVDLAHRGPAGDG